MNNKIDTLAPIGFGAAPLGNLYQPMSDQQARSTMAAALSAGFKYIDTAPHYGFGLSERRVGDALRGVKDSVISTKVGRLLKPTSKAEPKLGFDSPMPFEPVFDYSYDGVMRSFEDSLQRTGLSKIDILYMHDLGRLTHGDQHSAYFKQAMNGGFKALAELKQQGVITGFGLGVNEVEICEEVMAHIDLDIILLAGRYTLLEQTVLDSFFPLCLKKNTKIVLGGPYNSGVLAVGTRGQAISTLKFNYQAAPSDIVAKVKQLEAVCDEHSVALAAAALQFCLMHPVVASVVPGVSTVDMVAHTSELAKAKIPPAFWEELKAQNLIRGDAPTQALPAKKHDSVEA